jgi:hypothetical protein
MGSEPNRETRTFLHFILYPVIIVCGFVLSSLYKGLFGWWLDGWMSKGSWRRLEKNLRKDYPFLFEKYGATVVPWKPHRQVMDYVDVTVAVGTMLLTFTKGMGNFHVSVAPAHARLDYYGFTEAINLARESELEADLSTYYRMSDFPRLFEANIDCLNHFFSKESYGDPRRDRSVTKLIPL